jgi:hypothetical protein
VILGLICSRRWPGAAVLGLVVVAFFSIEVGRPTAVFQATTGSSDMASGQNRASTLVVADDGGVSGCRYLCEGIVYGVIVVRLGLLWGNPRSGAPGSNNGGARRPRTLFWSRCRLEMVLLWWKPQIWVSRIGRWRRTTPLFLLGASFWSRPWLEVALRWSGMSLSVSTTVRISGLVPRSLDGGHGLRCVRREEAPSGAMVASSAGSAKFMRILTMKIAWRFDGSDDFCSVYMRCSLSVC